MPLKKFPRGNGHYDDRSEIKLKQTNGGLLSFYSFIVFETLPFLTALKNIIQENLGSPLEKTQTIG